MNFLKTFGLWIVLGVATIALLVLQIVYVGGMRSEAAEKNRQIKEACESARSLRRKVRSNDFPTRGDIKESEKHLAEIKKQRVEVEAKWRKYTEGLNAYMRSQDAEEKPEGGEIYDPDKVRYDAKTGKIVDYGSPITWELFGARIRDLYKKIFKDMEAALQEKMRPGLEEMIRDEKYAASETMIWEDAVAEAKGEAETRAKVASRILKDKDKLILVPVDTPFSAEEPEQGWREWRKYLLTRDILLRAVAGTEVKFKRTLSAYVMPTGRIQDDEARKKRAALKAEGEKVPELKTQVWERDSYRCVEQVVDLQIEGPVYGNAELSGPGWTAERAKESKKKKGHASSTRRSGRRRRSRPSKGDKEAEAADKPEDPLQPQEPPKGRGVEPRYHDVFTVTIKIDAHPKVVQAFHRKLLASTSIWYAPLSMKIERITDAEAMGVSQESQAIGAAVEGLGEALLPEVAPLRATAGFGHEPYVKATLKYEVYRFRYSDIDNYWAPVVEKATEERRSHRTHRGGPEHGSPDFAP